MVAITASGDGRFDMGRVINRTFGVIGRNFGTFAVLTLLLSAVPQVLSSWGSETLKQGTGFDGLAAMAALLGGIGSLVGVYLLQAAITRATIADLNGRRISVGVALSVGGQYVLPLFGLALLTGLALFLGFLLLIVPGIIMSVLWVVAAPAVVVERRGVTESFGRSRALTKGHRWPIFGLMLVYGVVYVVFLAALGGVAVVVTPTVAGLNVVDVFVVPLIAAITSMIGAAGVAALYYELRSAKEGVGAEALASVFD